MHFETPYEFPDLTGKRVLVIGLGGGCDSLVAYAFAKDMILPLTHCHVAVYANTIGPRPLEGHPKLAPYILSVPCGDPTPLTPGDNFLGTTKIECSLPRGPENSPLLFIIPHKTGTSLDQVFHDNKEALLTDIEKLNFDFIFGVDTGGDSLTGGIDWVDHPALGRDRQMLALLTWGRAPFLHVMIAPCSDGESSFELMEKSIGMAINSGHYRGKFSCSAMTETLREVSVSVGSLRTPCIMLQALDGKLESVGSDRVVVPRNIKPVVPRHWLWTGFVFEWPQNLVPSYGLPDMAKV